MLHWGACYATLKKTFQLWSRLRRGEGGVGEEWIHNEVGRGEEGPNP